MENRELISGERSLVSILLALKTVICGNDAFGEDLSNKPHHRERTII